MTFFIKDVRNNEVLAGPYSNKQSASRSYNSRGFGPEIAVITNDEWRERERVREDLIDLTQFGLTNIKDHFLHVSKKSNDVEFLVSYTENAIKGERDIQSPGRKIGRYLKDNFEHLDGVQIEKYAADILMKMTKVGLKFASTREELKALYENRSVTSSCMGKSASSEWNFRDENNKVLHPVEAYAGPDLKGAFITDKSGNVTARAMCWPDKKIYGRIYGDVAKITALFKQLGWAQANLTGARMSTIQIHSLAKANGDKSTKYILAPYIDGPEQRVHFNAEGVLILGNDPKGKFTAMAAGTAGYTTYREFRCMITNNTFNESQVAKVYNGKGAELGYIDKTIIHEHATDFGGRFYKNDASNMVETFTGKKVPQHYAESSMLLCIITNKYMEKTEYLMTAEGPVNLADGMTLFARCELSGDVVRRSAMKWMEHGVWWSDKIFKKLGVTGSDGKFYASILYTQQKAA